MMQNGHYVMTDDSVTLPGVGNPQFSGKSVTKRGEEYLREKNEPGRFDRGTPKRPSGISDARDPTSVHPEEVIDPRMPQLITA
jgi:hypothetical protein